jgi:hypothetical protein
VSLILHGRLVVAGSLEDILACVPALARISRHYRQLSGQPPYTVFRHEILPEFGVRAEHLACIGAPSFIRGDDPGHQAVVACALLLGLHPICRRAEIEQALDDFIEAANQRHPPRDPAPRRLLELVADMAAAGSANWLGDVTRSIRAEHAQLP